MRRRGALGIEQIAARDAGEAAERRGRVGHAKGGETDPRDRQLEILRHDRERIEVRGLALVGGHAGRGVALDVLDRLKSFARGELHVARGDIVLPVHEGLDRRLGGSAAGSAPEVGARARGSAPRPRSGARAALRAHGHRSRRAPRRGVRARGRAVRQGAREVRDAAASAHGTLALRRLARQKACSVSSQTSLPRDCENRCTLGVNPPDISNASQSMRRPRPPASPARLRQGEARTRQIALRAEHRRCRQDLMPGAARRFGQCAGRLGAKVGDGGDADAGGGRSSAA